MRLMNNIYLLLMAESSVHGMFVAPSTSTPSLSFPTPAKQLIVHILIIIIIIPALLLSPYDKDYHNKYVARWRIKPVM